MWAQLITKIKLFFQHFLIQEDDPGLYNLESFYVDSRGRGMLKIHPKHSPSIFNSSIKEVFENKELLNGFNKKQVSYIALLYASELSGNLKDVIKNISFNEQHSYKYLNLISMLFITVLLLSNIVSPKVVSESGFAFTVSSIYFPFIYILAALVTEVYGYKQIRRIIWWSLACNIIFVLGTTSAILLPGASFWELQLPFGQILSYLPHQIVASLLAFSIAEFLNSYTQAKLKVYTHGKLLWVRCCTSTAVGIVIDSIIFCLLAFSATLNQVVVWNLIFHQIVIKLLFVVMGSWLITVPVSNLLKRVEQVDYYDNNTKFTPFSLKLVD